MATSKNFLSYAFYTGLLAGTLDLAGAIVNYRISKGSFPYRILEYIASGAFGKEAMNGSIGSNLWGAFFHYFIAISFAFFYFLIYPRAKFLQKSILLSAVIYGLFVWAVTNMIVLPLSALQAPVVPTDLIAAAKAAFILMVCIGLPVAYFAKKFYAK
jgi:uncharacterized membrane protein YagU involved in acid resistance